MPSSLGLQGLIFLVVTAAACLQGSIGFGFALVAAPILVLIDPSFVPGPVMVNAAVLTTFIFLRERQSVDLTPVRWAVLGNLLGTTVAGTALSFVSAYGFSLLFSIVVLAAVVLSVMGFHPRVTQRNATVAGVASGFMGTTSSIGGPPMAILFQAERGAVLRGNLSAYFLCSTLIGLSMLAFIGRFGKIEIELAQRLLPGLLFGFVLSLRTSRLLDGGAVRPLVLALSSAAAIVILIRTLSM
jgi:uncharacterized membrane protein YfcA